MTNSALKTLNNFLSTPVFADDGTGGKIINPVIGNLGSDPEAAASGSLFTDYAVRLWRTGISIGALIVLAYFILGAYEWLTSGDDTKGVEKAKSRFTNATIGLVLLVGSFVIIAFVGSLLFGEEFDILNLTFPTD